MANYRKTLIIRVPFIFVNFASQTIPQNYMTQISMLQEL